MAKIFSTIPPFLCKSSRVRKWVPLFDGHLFHDHASDLILLCFYRFTNIQIKAWFFIFEFRSIEVKLSRNQFLCGTNFLNTLYKENILQCAQAAISPKEPTNLLNLTKCMNTHVRYTERAHSLHLNISQIRVEQQKRLKFHRYWVPSLICNSHHFPSSMNIRGYHHRKKTNKSR